MTDAVAVALIAGLPVTLAALGGLITVLRTGADTKVILGHVNSERTALLTENRMLREQLATAQAAAGLLAQAQAARDAVPG
ncbi:MAG: hypothetical protein V4597_08645 [Pseudomonadota bacterium]